MKMAAAIALANLARQEAPPEVSKAYSGLEKKFGKEYIIPTPFDPRLITEVSIAVAKAAIQSGVASKVITDWKKYQNELEKRMGKPLL